MRHFSVTRDQSTISSLRNGSLLIVVKLLTLTSTQLNAWLTGYRLVIYESFEEPGCIRILALESIYKIKPQSFSQTVCSKRRPPIVSHGFLAAVIRITLFSNKIRFSVENVVSGASSETQVKNKSWFGMNAALRDLSKFWTIQEEAMKALAAHTAT